MVCLTGNTGCNGTCPLDPLRPLAYPEGQTIMCTNDCKEARYPYKQECNGKCIKKYDPCNGVCPEGRIFCNKTSECIYLTNPCGDECLSPKYPKLQYMGWRGNKCVKE